MPAPRPNVWHFGTERPLAVTKRPSFHCPAGAGRLPIEKVVWQLLPLSTGPSRRDHQDVVA
jgi:hypothetical protein